MQDSNATFNQHLHQWVASYLGAPNDEIASTLLPNLVRVIRSMQENGVLKPIIFYQVMMVAQALKTTGQITVSECQARIKKMLAILYNENEYVEKLSRQVLSAILVADRAVNANPNNAPLLNQLRGQGGDGAPDIMHITTRGPPPGPIA